MADLEERIDRLERLYEKLYHETELLSIYIPRLTDTLIKHFSASQKLRYEIFGDLRSLQSVLSNILEDLQVHYKSHFDETKTKVDASKRSTRNVL